MKRWLSGVLTAIMLCTLLGVQVFAKDLPDPPEIGYVQDLVDVISDDTRRQISRYNESLQDSGAQIGVLVVDYLGVYADSIADYSKEVFNEWGVGDKSKGNGVLFVLAIENEDYYCAI